MKGGPTQRPIRIVVADDQAVVRAGLHVLLDREPDFTVVAETADVVTTVSALRSHAPDALVLDATGPGELGIAALPRLTSACPATAIVILTLQAEPAVAREALRAGAHGYVLKHSAGVELIDAVRAAVHGETYLSPALGARLATGEGTHSPGGLTEREICVLRLIALGYTNSEIALQLYLSVRTVESHRAHIQQKLRLTTRAELVRYALDHDLLDR